MDNILKSAFIASQVACMQAEIAAMQAENDRDKFSGVRTLSYSPTDFRELVNRYQLGHNDVLTYLNG